MADSGTFSSSSPPPPPPSPLPPIMHHSSLFNSSPPPLSSSLLARNRLQVSSPHLHPQITSPHLCPQTHVTSPHLHPQVTSPHPPHPQVTSPHLPHPQVTSPHLLSLPQHLFSKQTVDVDHPEWSRSEPPAERPYLLTTAHLDHQNQNQFSTGASHYRPPYNSHIDLAGGVYGQGDTPGPGHDTWRPTLPQGGWSSVDFTSSSAEDFSSTRFFHHSCHDNSSAQPFCSPTTPGLSPHYPQTPTLSSPDAQCHPGKEKQTLRQVGEDQTLHWCLDEYDSYRLTSDPSQPRPLQTSRHLLHNHRDLIQDQTGLLHSHRDLIQDQMGVLHNHRDLIQDQTGVLHSHRDLIQEQMGLHTAANSASCFCPQGRGQDVSSTAPPTGLPVKRLKPEDDSALLKSRLLCSVCQRDFRSLPALNGHMRSHSRSRSASWSNKGDDSSAPTVQPSVSMVMPVSVPVQSKACRSGQRRGSHLSPATGGAALLYCSLLHHGEEEAVAEDGEAGDGAVAMGDSAHYTPPPMLCPIRAGPGLYCSLATRRQQKAQAVQLHNTHNGLSDLVSIETASPPPGTILNKPRINEGRSFQAEIPPLLGREHTDADPHNALLLWTPWDELERPVNRQRVEALMMMARSSVVPGGGASPESALHVLSECRGDFLLTVQKLLSTPETSDDHTAPHHQGVRWSTAERRMMVKSLHLHHKDFRRVHETVQTKSLSQCVEFYYLWKKKLSLIRRPPAGLTISLPNTKGQRSPGSHDAS
ncbi:transcriptional-regulating factor 1-like isoform X2 [Epinephelus moara]|uniref:transcriptional-regulating factor 1-like isoform X2 n=1 Tax=Epinephelus moara TaxID=300413 RepID=UPI00214E5CB6|nr:transcriptional-regulating factor 1-like isoform X2 [Epinephelus moara]